MPPKRNTNPGSPLGSRRTRSETASESPEWIDRLRRRVQSESPAKQAWAQKAINVLMELMDLSDQSLSEAALLDDDWLALLRAMSAPKSLKKLQAADPLAGAFLRGIEAKRRLIRENGGVYSTEQAAEFLGTTAQEINKRRTSRKLLGLVFRSKGYLYPVWQFDKDRGTLPGLEAVLLTLADHDEWMQNIFFVSRNTRLNERRPLDLLRQGEIEPVIEAAKSMGEQGAA
jgi:hypothetical protein